MTDRDLARANETLTYQLVEARLVIQVQAAYILDLERRMRGEPMITLHAVTDEDVA
jgi:hypothetical protein